MRWIALIILSLSAAVASAAVPSFKIMLSPGVAPCTIHVNGLTALGPKVDPTRCQFAWDFGDPTARFDTLPGFNAAHCYDHAGKYTISLRLTDPAGHVRNMSTTVVVDADTRQTIYVAPNGIDTNTGLAPQQPLHSLVAAFKKLTNNSEILIHAGASYTINQTLDLTHTNVLVSRYGNGSDPVLIKTLRGPIISSASNGNGDIIQHLKFTTPHGIQSNGQAPKVGVQAIMARGRNFTVRDCEFDNVDEAVNSNGKPAGLLVQDCRAPSPTGLRAYLVWGQGSDHVYIGNEDANSTREHCIRTAGVIRQLVAYNTFANLDRRPGDPGDYSKGCIEIHRGSYAWVANNTVTDGDIRTGPLGGSKEPPSSATDWCVVENNCVNESQISIVVGSHHIRVRNNVIHADNRIAIVVGGPDKYGRISGDITFTGNTAVNHGHIGGFLNVWGKVNGISLTSNLYIAPRLSPGKKGATFFSTTQNNLSDFTQITGNIWPALPKGTHPFRISSRGYIPFTQWLATPPVKGDRCENVKWTDPTSQPTVYSR